MYALIWHRKLQSVLLPREAMARARSTIGTRMFEEEKLLEVIYSVRRYNLNSSSHTLCAGDKSQAFSSSAHVQAGSLRHIH